MIGEAVDRGDEPAADRSARLDALLRVDVEVRDDIVPVRRGDRRREPSGTPTRRSPGSRVLTVLSLLVLFASGAGLLYAGASVIRDSTRGELVVPLTDPSEPGYEALVTPTPTLALLHDRGGEIDSIAVLTLPDPDGGGGGVVLVPTRIIADLPVFGVAPLEAAYDLGSPSVQAEAVGDLFVAAMGEFAVVDAERWEGLVAPVAPLVLDNPDALRVDGQLRFPDGRIRLRAEDVGAYLEARVEGESDLARLFRHRVFWDAWLDAVAADGSADAVPGELEVGLGRFVRAIASGPHRIETVAVTPAADGEFGPEPTFAADDEAIAELVAELIPFPRSPRDGVRSRVRVLNGTADLEAAPAAARLLPEAGVEVVFVGNAGSLEVAVTTIAYADERHRAVALELRDALGTGEVVLDRSPSDVVDITITLGADHE